MDLDLTGKIALVTGATSGVGREIALSLAAEGASVAVNYRSSAAEADALVNEITAKGGKAKAYKADVADFAAVKAMVERIVKDFGGLNILINNAGLAHAPAFSGNQAGRLAPPDRRLSLRRDPLLPRRGAASRCRQDGRIVSVIGDSSRVGESGLAIVAAARAGVVALMKSLAREFGRSGTTANTVSLGLVETPTTRHGSTPTARNSLQLYPLRRLGLPRRRGADGDLARLAACGLDHRPGAEHQRRLQHGVRKRCCTPT